MSILTNLPVTLTCGTPVVVTISKPQFVTDFAITDPFWSDPTNWQEIEFYYVDDTGVSQVKKMSFASNTYSLNLKTNTYDGTWLCKKVTIMDGNGATLIYTRAQFPIASEFDFASAGGIGAGGFIWETFYNNMASAGEGELHRTGGVGSWDNIATVIDPILGDFEFSGIFKLTAPPTARDIAIGYSKITVIPEGGLAGHGSYIYNFPSLGQTALFNTPNSFIPYATAIYLTNVPTTPIGEYPFVIKRVAGAITAKFNGVLLFTDTYAGPIYLVGTIYYDVGNSFEMCTLKATPLDTFFNGAQSLGAGEVSNNGYGSYWGNVATTTQVQNGDFNFSGKIYGGEIFLGYTKTIVTFGSPAPSANVTASLEVSSNIQYTGGSHDTNTAIQDLPLAPISFGYHTFEIERIAGVITAKFDGVQYFHDNYAGPVYPVIDNYNLLKANGYVVYSTLT